MKTKCIVVKSNKQSYDAMAKISFFSDSPHWQFLLIEWLEDADYNSEYTLDYFNYIQDDIEREKDIEDLCKTLEHYGFSFYRVLRVTKYYNYEVN